MPLDAPSKFRWTDENEALLRELWPTGKSTTQIAHVLGAGTRNVPIGKAKRMGLGPKPSAPSGREGSSHRFGDNAKDRWSARSIGRTKRKHKEPIPRLARAPRPAKRPSWFEMIDEAPGPESLGSVEIVLPELPGSSFGVVGATEALHRDSCRYPVGDPLARDFRFCMTGAMQGRSYCPGHMRLVYQYPRERRAA